MIIILTTVRPGLGEPRPAEVVHRRHAGARRGAPGRLRRSPRGLLHPANKQQEITQIT